jgi:hypothetical protein
MTRRRVGVFDAIGKIDWDRFRFDFYRLSFVIAETGVSESCSQRSIHDPEESGP